MPGVDEGAIDTSGADILWGAVDANVHMIVVGGLFLDGFVKSHEDFLGVRPSCEFGADGGAHGAGHKDELDVNFFVHEEMGDERGVFGDVEFDDAAVWRESGAAVIQFDHVVGQDEIPVFVGQVVADIGVAAGVVTDGVGDVAPLTKAQVSEEHDRVGVQFFHGAGGIGEDFDEVVCAVGDAAFKLNRKLAHEKAWRGQGLAIDEVAIARIADGKSLCGFIVVAVKKAGICGGGSAHHL